jgi:arylsulfatase A
MKKEISLFTILGISVIVPKLTFCQDNSTFKSNIKKPNIILILADDLGYETLGCNGGLSYKTPHLDKLASQGIRFTQCYASPLSSPSRLALMTGQYNFRNYEYFEYLSPTRKTFGNLLQEAGYVTAIAGKWQLNGIRWKYPSALDPTTANHFGFDEYCLWQLTHTREEGERYANPLLEKNGKVMDGLKDSYGPDALVDFINDFIHKNKEKPFFVYYSMVLTHDPFVTTPDSHDWLTTEDRYIPDTAYFKDMVSYMDKNVGRLVDNLKKEGLWDNTIIIFTGDNGTNVNILSKTIDGVVQGGKGFTINSGTHVPLIVVWPHAIKKARVYNGLVKFPDFLPTLADISGADACSYSPDGVSFMPVIQGKLDPIQDEIFIHYTPEWGNFPSDRWVFNSTYKLYRDGSFYNTVKDPLEKNKLTNLSFEEKKLFDIFEKIIKEKESEYPFEWCNASDKNPRSGAPNFRQVRTRPESAGRGPTPIRPDSLGRLPSGRAIRQID